jgi:transmembrane 9 superfamily member 2/4
MGDRISRSPYALNMKHDSFCKHLCMSSLGRSQSKEDNKLANMIRHQYHNNWIVDNLPSASISEVMGDGAGDGYERTITKYWQGFPIGFVQQDDPIGEGSVYIHNHVNIHVTYRQAEKEKAAYHVLRFLVEPLSIRHMAVDDLAPTNRSDDSWEFSDSQTYNVTSPIESCQAGSQSHTTREMAQAAGPQLAEGNVLFTYDVIWTEDRNAAWSTRWDIYLNMDHAVPDSVHWASISNAIVSLMLLGAGMCAILIRILRRGVTQELPNDEEVTKGWDEGGWKSVHAHVFRPPASYPMLLSVMCGTGAQLLCTTISVVVLCNLGFMSPAYRGNFLTVGILVFVAMGTVAGYVSSRYYKTFQGSDRTRVALWVAFGFPGTAFAVFGVVSMMAGLEGSSLAVPFVTLFVLAVLWLAISTPLVFLGVWLGSRMDVVEFPVKTSDTPRDIPKQAWFKGVTITLVILGVI